MMDKHENGEHECGCGGMCMWMSASKEKKVEFLEKKEAKLEKMLAHVKKVKEAIASGKEMPHEEDKK